MDHARAGAQGAGHADDKSQRWWRMVGQPAELSHRSDHAVRARHVARGVFTDERDIERQELCLKRKCVCFSRTSRRDKYQWVSLLSMSSITLQRLTVLRSNSSPTGSRERARSS